MLSEFRTFISRGNVMDMAVGIIIGAAFTAIVSSLVADLIDPVIGLFLGGVDFSDLFVVLGAGEYPSIVEAEEAGAAIFAYGRFIMAVINFLIIAFVVFMERGQRRITINYAKRQQGRKVFAAQTSHLPLKVNMAGVIPPIFASSILLFPASIGQWFGQTEGMEWLQDMSLALGPGQPLYILLFAISVIFFWKTSGCASSSRPSVSKLASAASLSNVRTRSAV